MIDPFYEKLLRSTIFRMDAEEAHELTIHGLGWMSRLKPLCRWLHSINGSTAKDPVRLFGLQFPNHVGLAAGLDKNAQCLPAFAAMGFGHVEAGTVTPKQQPGNERPRLFRYPQEEAIINRMGSTIWGRTHIKPYCPFLCQEKAIDPVGVNIGKARSTALEDALGDYLPVSSPCRPS